MKTGDTSSTIPCIVSNVLRFVVAAAFIISGFVKAVDPLGTVYKLNDYAEAFHLSSIIPSELLLPATMLLCLFEFILGICILFCIWRRTALTAALVFIGLMTPITLILAINNPVSDCGCFGDAIILTNWQTFEKNVVLLTFLIFILFNNHRLVRLIHYSWQWIIITFAIVSMYVFMEHNLRHLPVIDYRAYHVGANLEESMKIPEDAPQARFETLFTLTRDGKEREFTLEDYPDSTWTFVRSRSMLIDPGYVPPITDFALIDADGEDLTDTLFEPGWTFLLVMNSLRGEDMLDAINDLYDYSSLYGCNFYALTSATSDRVEKWKENTGARYQIFHMDDITLKTIIRSDPGLLLIHDGIIVNKWSRHDLPGDELFSGPPETQEWTTCSAQEVEKKHLRAILWMFLPYLFIALLCFFVPHSEEDHQQKAYRKRRLKKQEKIIQPH